MRLRRRQGDFPGRYRMQFEPHPSQSFSLRESARAVNPFSLLAPIRPAFAACAPIDALSPCRRALLRPECNRTQQGNHGNQRHP